MKYVGFSLSGCMYDIHYGRVAVQDIIRIFCNFDVAQYGIAFTLNSAWMKFEDLKLQLAEKLKQVPMSRGLGWRLARWIRRDELSLRPDGWEAGQFNGDIWQGRPLSFDVTDWLVRPVVSLPPLDWEAAKAWADVPMGSPSPLPQ